MTDPIVQLETTTNSLHSWNLPCLYIQGFSGIFSDSTTVEVVESVAAGVVVDVDVVVIVGVEIANGFALTLLGRASLLDMNGFTPVPVDDEMAKELFPADEAPNGFDSTLEDSVQNDRHTQTYA